MIDLKELGLYNWLYDPLYHKVQIHCINCFDTYYDRFDPIPLTPEILEKAGFEYDKIFKIYTIETETGEIILSEKFILQSTDTITQLTYLHQLQNLYFALTGTELNIEL